MVPTIFILVGYAELPCILLHPGSTTTWPSACHVTHTSLRQAHNANHLLARSAVPKYLLDFETPDPSACDVSHDVPHAKRPAAGFRCTYAHAC